MKILLSSYSGYGASFILRLQDEGHSVDYFNNGPRNTKLALQGMIPLPLTAEPNYAKYDLVLFDLTGKPKQAEAAMLLAPTLGDGDFNTEIEDNRLMGIEIMEECGINVPFWEGFDDLGEAKKFIRKTNKRYVFKPNGGQSQDTAATYVSKSADDLLQYLDKLGASTKGQEFILQEVVSGTEVSTEAWFNGEDFYLVNGTLEEKKFMEGNKGPATGCSGNLVWVYDDMNPPLVFREGLQKMKDFLQQYNYRGMIDLNTIVSDREIYGLEWTPRFGYDASATLFNLISSDLGEFMAAIASGARPNIQLSSTYSVGIRLSIPPYPTEIEGHHPADIPIQGLCEDDCTRNCYLYDVMLDGEDFVTAGISGFIAVPIYSGQTIAEAFSRTYEKIKCIQIPDMQYRADIEKLTHERYKILGQQGWLR